MVKRAVCVGINDYPGVKADLKGCVNDAKAWSALLLEHYGFSSPNVKVLLDAQATKANVMVGIKWLLAGAAAGDTLVFTNSSHGTYLVDTSGDEEYDQALCPFDCDKHLIVDDELRELFGGLPKGVSLSVIADCCHSGTVTRAAAAAATSDDRRARFLDPSLIGRAVLKEPALAAPSVRSKYPESKMKEILLSGCTSTEFSYDAQIDGQYHGAMSCFALKAIRSANYAITWEKLYARIGSALDAAEYPQHPQLEGAAANKKKRIFT